MFLVVFLNYKSIIEKGLLNLNYAYIVKVYIAYQFEKLAIDMSTGKVDERVIVRIRIVTVERLARQ